MPEPQMISLLLMKWKQASHRNLKIHPHTCSSRHHTDVLVHFTLHNHGTVHSTQFYIYCTWLSRALHTALLPGRVFPFPLTPTHVFHHHILMLQQRFTSYPLNKAHTVIQVASHLPENRVCWSTGRWNNTCALKKRSSRKRSVTV